MWELKGGKASYPLWGKNDRGCAEWGEKERKICAEAILELKDSTEEGSFVCAGKWMKRRKQREFLNQD